MTRNQIYDVVNVLASNTTAETTNVVNHSTFISFGQEVIQNNQLKDVVYGKLYDMIGRTIFAIDEYTADNRKINVDEFSFGAILQKISFKLQNASEDSDWKFPKGNSPYDVEPKDGIIQKLFKRNLGVFEYDDVIMSRQLNSAFESEEKFGGFVNGLYQRMRNAREVAKENLANETVATLVTEVYKEATNEIAINSRRVRNLLAEYKTINQSSTLTADTCLRDRDFLEFACVEMSNVIPFMAKLTSRYNNGEVERRTLNDDLIVELNSQLESYIEVYLKSNTYHEELIKLPNYSSIPYWQNPTNPLTISTNDGTETTTIENVLAIYRDKDASACTLEYERTVSFYDEWNDRTPIKMTAERSYIVDTSENVVIFIVAD